MITKEKVLEKLKTVMDPELNVNIVDLGLIYDVSVDQVKKKVQIKMTLTTPGCPLSYVFDTMIKDAVGKIKGVKKVEIDLVWEPAWTPDKMTKEAREELGVLD